MRPLTTREQRRLFVSDAQHRGTAAVRDRCAADANAAVMRADAVAAAAEGLGAAAAPVVAVPEVVRRWISAEIDGRP
jgi:hypothetical protein